MIPGQQELFSPAHMVDLFAGPGGLDVAAHWLGVPVEGVEWDKNACKTRYAAELGTKEGDVREFGPADFPDATILAGGPPCQTYTVAGRGAGRRALDRVFKLIEFMAASPGIDKEDIHNRAEELGHEPTGEKRKGAERTGLVVEPLRWALEAYNDGRPYEAIVLEQVPAVLPVWQAVKSALEGIGYKATCGVLHTEEFGVPQTRRRAILIARRDREPELPKPTHRPYRKGVLRTAGEQTLLPWKTMGEALDRDGSFVVISNYGTGGDPKARGERRSDLPAATVTGKVSRNRLVTDDGFDRFTIREAGRLQTFPPDYPWSGKDQAQQVGNAIPPRLAAHVLAAALGYELNEKALDVAVQGSWNETKHSKPLSPSKAR